MRRTSNRRLLLVTPPLAVAVVGFAPALLFVRKAFLEAESSAAVRDAALVAFGVGAVAVALTYLMGLVALAFATAVGARLESLGAGRSVVAGIAAGALTGAGASTVIGTSMREGCLYGATLGLAAALVHAWLRDRLGAPPSP